MPPGHVQFPGADTILPALCNCAPLRADRELYLLPLWDFKTRILRLLALPAFLNASFRWRLVEFCQKFALNRHAEVSTNS